MEQIFQNDTQHQAPPATDIQKVCLLAQKKFPAADEFQITLYGTLAKTGKEQGIDTAIRQALYSMLCEIVSEPENESIPHPNTMDVAALSKGHAFAHLRATFANGDFELTGD